MKKIVIAAAVGVIVCIVGIVAYVFYNLNYLVADAIETYASRAIGSEVSVESVEIQLREGRGTVRGLRVANPTGFAEPFAFSFDEIVLDLDPKSLSSSPYVVEEVRILEPIASLAANERGEINMRVLQEQLQSGEGEEAEPEAGSGPPTLLQVRAFDWARGRVDVHLQAVGGEDVSRDLPPLHLKNLGSPGGAPPTEIARTVLSAYTRLILESAARDELTRRLEDAIDSEAGRDVVESAKGLLDRL